MGNDPVNFTDPSGLVAFLAPLAALGVEEAVAGLAVLGARLAPYITRAVAAIRGANVLSQSVPKDATIPMQDPLNPPAPLITVQPKATNAEKVGAESGVKVAGQTQTKQKSDCGDPKKNKGDCAEQLVNQKYKDEGYEIFDTKRLENKSGHGLDNIATKGDNVVVIETKANKSTTNKWQKKGGEAYTERQKKRMSKGLYQGEGHWKGFQNDDDFEEAFQELTDLLNNPTSKKSYKICRVIVKDDLKGCYGKNGKGNCEAEKITCEEWN